MGESLPIIIIAQSARFWAEQARQIGLVTKAADCFGDSDTRAAADDFLLLPPLATLTTADLQHAMTTLSAGENCQLVLGSGMDAFPDFLDSLPPHIQLIGNTASSIRRINQPATFFALLAEQGLPFPEVSWLPPEDTDNWLFKPARSLGGQGIVAAHAAARNTAGYFQREINGRSGAALFIANGKTAMLIGMHQQFNAAGSYALSGLSAPLVLSIAQQTTLTTAMNTLTASAELIGLNSLDFILTDSGEICLLEINPRLSASAALYATENELLSWHIAACTHGTLPAAIHPCPATKLDYLFAPQNITIPADIAWHATCHDLPVAGTIIPAHAPICSLLTADDNIDQITHQIYSQLDF